MKTYTFEYQDLENNLLLNEISKYDNILVQIFSGEGKEKLQKSSILTKKKLPKSVIVGVTTDGEIDNRNINTNSTLIAISVFEKTTITSFSVNTMNSFQNGVNIAQTLLQDNTKLLILFTDGSTCNGELFLKGIESINNKVMVCGGMAGDNGSFIQTYICENEHIIEQGAVGVALHSDELIVENYHKFNWVPIGIEHKIDECIDNRVYKIAGMKAIDFYEKYLGKEVAKALPKTGIEFPLILEKNGLKIARAILSKYDDGSLGFAGNLKKGDKVRIGFGNAEMIMKKSLYTHSKILNYKIETFFFYSCMARRRYIPRLINIEVEPYIQIAPTVGFFTYGEFYHHETHNELLNQTLTMVSLSESKYDKVVEDIERLDINSKDEYAMTIGALSHLIKQSADDYEHQREQLEKEKKHSQNLTKSKDVFIKHAVHETNTPLSVIMCNIDLFKMEFPENIYISNIEAAMKNMLTIYDDLSYLVKKNSLNYPLKKIDLISYIKNRIEFFNILASKKNLQLVFESINKEFIIYFNELKLQRIIDNNLTNAIKYTKENQPIYISAEIEAAQCSVIFKSRSIQIKDPQKIFEQYYRENTLEEGFGLGLNLVKEICNNENITITVTSSEDETSFCYKFTREKSENIIS